MYMITDPVDTESKLNVHKTSRTSSERLMYVQFRDRRQITFVTLNGFCPLSKNPSTPPVLNGQCRTDGKPTKIG